MNTLQRDLQKCLPSSGFFYSMTLSPNVQKIVKKKKLNVKSLNYETNVYETNDDRDFKTETVDNFPSPFNEFYISQDSFKDIVDKYVVNI